MLLVNNSAHRLLAAGVDNDSFVSLCDKVTVIIDSRPEEMDFGSHNIPGEEKIPSTVLISGCMRIYM
jgi:hypothetical protein